MGIYATGKKRTRSINDTLSEAEHDHFLDCPNADLFIRIAATLLDGILFFLLASGVEHSSSAIAGASAQISKIFFAASVNSQEIQQIVLVGAQVFQFVLGYLYFFITVTLFGGSPAKLLLGLRVLDASSGKKLTPVRAMARELLRGIGLMAGGIGPLLALLRKDHLALHDLTTNTVVKKVHGGP